MQDFYLPGAQVHSSSEDSSSICCLTYPNHAEAYYMNTDGCSMISSAKISAVSRDPLLIISIRTWMEWLSKIEKERIWWKTDEEKVCIAEKITVKPINTRMLLHTGTAWCRCLTRTVKLNPKELAATVWLHKTNNGSCSGTGLKGSRKRLLLFI